MVARYYGESLETYNKTEARALQEFMGWLAANKEKWGDTHAVAIFGNSQLIINFFNRRARPAVEELYESMQVVKEVRE